MTAVAAPIVKWAGGKGRLLMELAARAPVRFGRYFEPFAGGAAMFFMLGRPGSVIGDVNADLIATYRHVAGNVDAVIIRLRDHERLHGLRHYNAVKRKWNRPCGFRDGHDRAAAFLYLNRACFNGLWRVNRAGQFNVPMDTTRTEIAFDLDNLRAAAETLKRAHIRSGGYRETLAPIAGWSAARGDLVYFDPPYDPVSETASFTGYAAGGFTRDDQRALASYAYTLQRRGVAVMLSNSDTPFVRSQYLEADGWRVDVVSRRGTMNSKPGKRGRVPELIITGGYER